MPKIRIDETLARNYSKVHLVSMVKKFVLLKLTHSRTITNYIHCCLITWFLNWRFIQALSCCSCYSIRHVNVKLIFVKPIQVCRTFVAAQDKGKNVRNCKTFRKQVKEKMINVTIESELINKFFRM